MPAYGLSHLHRSAAEQKGDWSRSTTINGTVPTSLSRKRPYHCFQPAESSRSQPNSNPVQSTATFNSQSFVSSGRQCRQCRHQCNHPLAHLAACCCTLPFIITYLTCIACMHVVSCLAKSNNPPCSAWRPFRIRCATADPPCCCLVLLLLLLLLIADCYSFSLLSLSLLLPSLRSAPTIWDLGPGTSHLESFV